MTTTAPILRLFRSKLQANLADFLVVNVSAHEVNGSEAYSPAITKNDLILTIPFTKRLKDVLTPNGRNGAQA